MAWPDTHALGDSNIYFSAKTFRQRPLLSQLRECSVNGDFQWTHSLLRNSEYVVFNGDVRTDSWRTDSEIIGDFMYNTDGGFAISENFEAQDVRKGDGKTIVGRNVSVEKADESSHFLVSEDYDINMIGRKARTINNISEFSGDWEELKEFFVKEVPDEEKYILGVEGFEQESYDPLNELRREITERRINWNPGHREGSTSEFDLDISRSLGYNSHTRNNPEAVLSSLEAIIDAQAILSSKTMEQDLETGDVETHYKQAEQLSDPDFDLMGDNEIGLESQTRCRLCGRYVDNVARYFRTIRDIEEGAERRSISSEALNEEFDISYKF